MEDVMDELDAYLAENRDRFTREALTRELVNAGHGRAAVEAAWARLEGQTTSPMDPITSSSAGAPGDGTAVAPGAAARPAPLGPGAMLLIVLVVIAYGAAIIAAIWAMFVGGPVSILMLVYAVAMFLGGWYVIRRIRRAEGGAGSAIGVALAIAVVIFVGLSGLCFAALGPVMNLRGGL
jgi:hypothetical protein